MKYIFFDLDNTLTMSRAPMHTEHEALFANLCEAKEVCVVTGGAESQIRLQIPLEPVGHYAMLSQQGNYVVDKDGTLLWKREVTEAQARAVQAFALTLTNEFIAQEGLVLKDPNDIFVNRGSQLASSIIGFHERNEIKYAVDPDQSKRRALLARHPEELAELRELGIEAMPGGTTTFDFILTGMHKGHNIGEFIARKGWARENCLYVGDALFTGGNDETVIGVIETHSVRDPNDTFRFIADKLLA